MNIALDGPAGAGKSSIAKLVAKKLSFVYLDTGAMYRTIALYVLNNGISPADEEAVVARLDDIEITLSHENGEQQIFLNGTNVSKEIRREEVGKTASTVAKYGKVRKKLVSLQQKIASENDVIMDGRDIGTVVLPNAEVKIYLPVPEYAPSAVTRNYRKKGKPVIWIRLKKTSFFVMNRT